MSQDFDNAILCYEKCIACEESDQDAAPHYREAALCIKEKDTDKYVELTRKAIELYSLSGRASTAAGMAKDCATFLEENYDYETAIEFYAKAS